MPAQTLSLFEPREMLQYIEIIPKPKLFFKQSIFSQEETHLADAIDIDLYTRKRRMIPFAKPSDSGTLIDRTGFTTKTFRFPYVKAKMVTTAENILSRAIGQNIYMPNATPASKAAEQLGKDMVELTEILDRRIEWMCVQALTTGKIIITATNQEINFDVPSTHITAPSILWSESTATIMKDLGTWSRLIQKDSGFVPTAVIMGHKASLAFLQNEEIRKLLDNRRMEYGSVAPKLNINGTNYLCTLNMPDINCEVFSYFDVYQDDSGTEQELFPNNGILMIAKEGRYSIHYGPIYDNNITSSMKYYIKSWLEEDPSMRYLLLSSSPLPVPHHNTAFLFSTVVA